MNGINPFHNQNIIQVVGKSCSPSDKKTLKKLREVSTPHHNILKKPYFDLLQIQLSVDMKNNYLIYSIPSGSERKLNLKDPIFAQRIRVLEFTVGDNFGYWDITTSSFENMDIYHIIVKQLFSYVTTIRLLSLKNTSDPIKLSKFIRQFNNLKNIVFQIDTEYVEEQWINDLKRVLSTLKSSGIIFELRLLNYGSKSERIMDNMFAPEKGIKNVIHKLGFDSPSISNTEELERLAHLIIENQSIVSYIKLLFLGWHLPQMNEEISKNILNHLRTISSFVRDIDWCSDGWDIDLFGSISWPALISLRLEDYNKQLPDLSIPCPKLQSLKIESSESGEEVFFSRNKGTTFENDLKHIFSGCANSLKKLKIKSIGIEENFHSIRPNNYLHKYLQNLLPHTKVEVESVSD